MTIKNACLAFLEWSVAGESGGLLSRVGDVHGHSTRSARAGLFLSTRDRRSVGYRVPKEWASLTEGERGVGSLGAFKRGSRRGFLGGYGAFECRNVGCGVCGVLV